MATRTTTPCLRDDGFPAEIATVSRFVDVAIVSGKRAATYECDGKPA